jgi:hypothetical protein
MDDDEVGSFPATTAGEERSLTTEIIEAPYGVRRRSGASRLRGDGSRPLPKDVTEISSVSNGDHVNVYLSKELIELAESWERGAAVRWKVTDGKPSAILLTPAQDRRGYGLRASPTQRPRFTVPTAAVGRPAAVFEQTEVIASVEENAICVQLPPAAFTEEENEEAGETEGETDVA